MDNLFTAATAFPTAIYTGLLLVATVYWILVAFGGADADLLEPGLHGEVGGGVGDAVDGGLSLHSHGIFEFIGVGRVPLTLILSLLVLFSWTLSMLGRIWIAEPALAIMPEWLFAVLLGIAAFILAVPPTVAISRPLGRLFTLAEKSAEVAVIGRAVTITSQKVSEDFGTAVCETEGGDLILAVVLHDPARPLAKGDRAVVVDRNETSKTYRVAPLPPDALAPLPDAGAEPVDGGPASSDSPNLPA